MNIKKVLVAPSALSLTAVVVLVVSLGAAAKDHMECFRFSEGVVKIRIGHFTKKDIATDTFCLSAAWKRRGTSKNIQFHLKSGDQINAQYSGWSDHYSETDVRFTFSDGEPEPTQLNAKVEKGKLVSIKNIPVRPL